MDAGVLACIVHARNEAAVLARGSHACKFERHVRARASFSWSSACGSGVTGRRSIDRWLGKSDRTTVATDGGTTVAELPKLWAARVGA